VARRYVPLLLALSLIWGSSFMFIEIALDDIEPTVIMFLRLLFAGAVLWPLVLAGMGRRELVGEIRQAWKPLVVLGVVNAAVPFTLIAWGQQYIDSGIAAIANASVPIFVSLLAIRYRPSERATGLRLIGIVLGLVGVGVLAGVQPEGGGEAVIGTLAVVTASFLYAIGALFAQTHVAHTTSMVLVTGSTTVGTLFLLVPALLQLPGQLPTWETWVAVAVLGIGGMALGQFIYYLMIEFHGSTRASLVTYLLPPAALFFGVTFLDENLTVSAIAGLALILAGVALGSGALRPAPRDAVATAPSAR
jgi:drug/metabolite transporter (DMT)-like permease